MSGILRAAAPLARRLSAVPKGPMNATQATRSYAGARPARVPRASRGYFSPDADHRAVAAPRVEATAPPARAARLPVPPICPYSVRRRLVPRPPFPPLTPALPPTSSPARHAADPNAPPKVAYPWLDPTNPQNWKEEHVRIPHPDHHGVAYPAPSRTPPSRLIARLRPARRLALGLLPRALRPVADPSAPPSFPAARVHHPRRLGRRHLRR